MICIGCGCDEHHACTLPGGKPCAWIHAGAQGLAGICSACVSMYPPSVIEEELQVAEIAIAAAIDDGLEEPQVAEILRREQDIAINGTSDPALGPPIGLVESMERDRAELQARLDRAPPRLILPGDPEYFL